jgi:hypothetical protein
VVVFAGCGRRAAPRSDGGGDSLPSGADAADGAQVRDDGGERPDARGADPGADGARADADGSATDAFHPPADGDGGDGSGAADGGSEAAGDTGGDGGPPPAGPVRVVNDPSHGCAWRMHGKMFCWGSNESSELGTGAMGPISTAVLVPGVDDVVDVGTANNGTQISHTCAVTGSGSVYCWGANMMGQIGDGTRMARPSPTLVPGIGDAVAIAVGGQHSCALHAGGTMACWGSDRSGELGVGDGIGVTPYLPAEVKGLASIVQIAAGDSHTCALLADHSAWCWGANAYGEVGNNYPVTAFAPVQVLDPGGQPMTDAVEITCGAQHSCARRLSGRISCWGADLYGQSGDGQYVSEQPVPVDVVSLPAGVVELSRQIATCARTAAGAIWCWGFQLDATGASIQPATPLAVPSQPEPAASMAGKCFVTAGERVYCWGLNGYGALGTGDTKDHPSPVLVDGLSSL